MRMFDGVSAVKALGSGTFSGHGAIIKPGISLFSCGVKTGGSVSRSTVL
jgi:hypothetical protein